MRSIICKDGTAARVMNLRSFSFASVSGVQTGLKPSQTQKVCRLNEVDSKTIGEWDERLRNKEIKADLRKKEIWLEIEGQIFWAKSTNVEARKLSSLVPEEDEQKSWKFSFSEMKNYIQSNN